MAYPPSRSRLPVANARANLGAPPAEDEAVDAAGFGCVSVPPWVVGGAVVLGALALVYLLMGVVAGWVHGGGDYVLRAINAEGVEEGADVEFRGMTIGTVTGRRARGGVVEFDVTLDRNAAPGLVRTGATWAFSGAYLVGGKRHLVLEDAGRGDPAKSGKAFDLEPVPPLLRLWRDLLAVLLVVATLYLTLRYRSALGELVGVLRR